MAVVVLEAAKGFDLAEVAVAEQMLTAAEDGMACMKPWMDFWAQQGKPHQVQLHPKKPNFIFFQILCLEVIYMDMQEQNPRARKGGKLKLTPEQNFLWFLDSRNKSLAQK